MAGKLKPLDVDVEAQGQRLNAESLRLKARGDLAALIRENISER